MKKIILVTTEIGDVKESELFNNGGNTEVNKIEALSWIAKRTQMYKAIIKQFANKTDEDFVLDVTSSTQGDSEEYTLLCSGEKVVKFTLESNEG